MDQKNFSIWIEQFQFNVAQLVQLFFDRVENIVGKGENAGYQHFLLFSKFPEGLSLMDIKSHHCVTVRGKNLMI